MTARRWFAALTGAVLFAQGGQALLADETKKEVSRFGALEAQGIDPLAALQDSLDPFSRMVIRNLGALAAAQAGLGVVTLVIGVDFLRLRPWSRRGLEILAWIILAASSLSGIWEIVSWFGPGIPLAGALGTGWLAM